jgi:hypothetical protein
LDSYFTRFSSIENELQENFLKNLYLVSELNLGRNLDLLFD